MIVPLAIRRLDHAPQQQGHATTPRKHLAAIYGRDWEALIGGREPLWQDELKFRGFFGIDKGEPPYNTRFSAAAVINGAVLFHHPSTMEWLVFDNVHARVRLPDGLLATTHRFQALDGSRWGWRPPRPLP